MTHPLFNRIKIPVIIMIVSIAVVVADFMADYAGFGFGEMINAFHPCKQDPLQPLFCYAAYDILLVLLMTGIFILSLLFIIIKMISFWRSNKKIVTSHNTE